MNEITKSSFKLGFGMMRLPRKTAEEIDIEQTKEMVDRFLEAGGRYFDTAYVYQGSEDAIRQALCERYPRDSYLLASKLNAADFCCKSEEEARGEIHVSLERTGAQYLDLYLLHGLSEGSISRYEEYRLWDYVRELKEQGLIRHYGFSFHDKAEILDQLLNDHPDTEFVQLQINYADWEGEDVQSRACYEVAEKHGVPVIVMEPVKGGLLADPPKAVKDLLTAANPQASPASWAIRFAASLPGTAVILSGMSDIEQVEDNLSYMKDFKPLTDKEQETIVKAREILDGLDKIPCTSCAYCMPGCPVKISIPGIFAVMNIYKMYDNLSKARMEYVVRPLGPRASECIACGQCESACPQHLPIISLLEEAKEKLEV